MAQKTIGGRKSKEARCPFTLESIVQLESVRFFLISSVSDSLAVFLLLKLLYMTNIPLLCPKTNFLRTFSWTKMWGRLGSFQETTGGAMQTIFDLFSALPKEVQAEMVALLPMGDSIRVEQAKTDKARERYSFAHQFLHISQVSEWLVRMIGLKRASICLFSYFSTISERSTKRWRMRMYRSPLQHSRVSWRVRFCTHALSQFALFSATFCKVWIWMNRRSDEWGRIVGAGVRA